MCFEFFISFVCTGTHEQKKVECCNSPNNKKVHPCASAIKNCNVNFILCYPCHSAHTHISTPTTLMVAENVICRKTEKFSVCCCLRLYIGDVIAFSHTTIKCIFVILVSVYVHNNKLMYLKCTLPMKCK